MEMAVPPVHHPTPRSVGEFFSETAAAISAIPGVSDAAFTSVLPLSGINNDKSFAVEGEGAAAFVPDEEFRAVTPAYFAALEIPLLHGRAFTSADSETAPVVAIVNEAFAQRYWPVGDALGKRIKLNAPAGAPWMQVVGVVGNVIHKGLDAPALPEFYAPHSQTSSRLMTLVARTNRPQAEVAAAIRARVRSIDPEQAISKTRLMERVIADSIVHGRLAFLLVSLFALIAVFFGATGVYGVLANVFLARRRELAMRIALGAQRAAILHLVFQRSFFLLGSGIVLGLPLALLANNGLGLLRHDVRIYDPATFICALTLLAATSFAATFIPARRAAAVDPMRSLRCD
jgi:putative ABC transport system permease protein